jgi:hypothetical protein
MASTGRSSAVRDAQMKTHRRPIKQLDKRLRKDVLARVLLHVIATPFRIDDSMNRSSGNLLRNDVNHSAGRIVFVNIQHRDVAK